MKRKIGLLMLSLACAALWSSFGAQPKKDNLPRLPGAVLLVGYAPPLMLTTPNETWKLQESKEDSAVTPTMSRDGSIVAAGRVVKCCNPRIVMIQTYSMAEKKWADYKEIEGGGTVVISPDGSKLAFTHFDNGPGTTVRVHFIDLTTKEESLSPAIDPNAGGRLSWSPDGLRVAFDVDPRYRSTISILDVRTGTVSKIAEGESPAWSPSGEWIAHFDNTRARVWLVRPDGTDKKLLLTLGPRRKFLGLRSFRRILRFAPVWSPDSKTLLINDLANADTWTFNIHLLDLSTLKLSSGRFKETVPVYGWAEAK